MSIPLSVMVLTKDSGRRIRAVLAALRDFDEVVVYDNGSSDDTLDIVREFANVTLIQGPFTGFGPMRRLATEKARHDWIFAVDSDEVVSKQLRDEIAGLFLEPKLVYSISRRNHFAGKPISCCGWSPDRVVRIFNRNSTGYCEKQVHESVTLSPNLTVVELDNRLDHFPFDSVRELVDKMQRYSCLWADDHAGKRDASAFGAIFKGFVAFLKNYFLKRGFLDGAEGLLISVANAGGVFFKYMKLREANLAKK